MTTMSTFQPNLNRCRPVVTRSGFLALLVLLSLGLASPVSIFAGKKKKDAGPPKPPQVIDYSNIVWPNPPAIPRIKYTTWYAAEKISQVEEGKDTKKAKWMDRLAGTQHASQTSYLLCHLSETY